MVGGNLIEIAEVTAPDGKPALRLWVVDRHHNDELAVLARPVDAQPIPELGEEIWWQSGRIYFRNDTHTLEKVSNSYDPTKVVAA